MFRTILAAAVAAAFLTSPAAADSAGGLQGARPAADAAAPVYRLGPSDVVSIRVIGHPDLQSQTRIDGEGKIHLPYAGGLAVGGMTPDAAAAHMAQALERVQLAQGAQVTVDVVSFGKQASILGAVGMPGTYPLDRNLTVTQLLARAGGARPDAAKHLMIRRAGEEMPQRIDLARLLGEGDLSLDRAIQDGDLIYVPEAPLYYLYGYVNAPGAYPLREPITVQQALAQGGGVAEMGSDGRLRIKRKKADGSVQEIDAELGDPIQPGDTVIVPERWF